MTHLACEGYCLLVLRLTVDGNIYGVSLQDGKQVWKYNAGHPISGGMAIGEQCMVIGEDASNGRLLCFQ